MYHLYTLFSDIGYIGTFLNKNHVEICERYYKDKKTIRLAFEQHKKVVNNVIWVLTLKSGIPYCVSADEEYARIKYDELVKLKQIDADEKFEYFRKLIGIPDDVKALLDLTNPLNINDVFAEDDNNEVTEDNKVAEAIVENDDPKFELEKEEIKEFDFNNDEIPAQMDQNTFHKMNISAINAHMVEGLSLLSNITLMD